MLGLAPFALRVWVMGNYFVLELRGCRLQDRMRKGKPMSNQESWTAERTKLRGYFTRGEIIQASRKDLEKYMVVLANTAEILPEEVEPYRDVVRHLLQVRIGEELHEKSKFLSIWALIVAGLSILISVAMKFVK
jgi:hypothetical protein